MESINLVELLKDCPTGMELDCIICNGVKFIELDRNPNFPIIVRANNGYEFSLTKYGQVHNIDDAKCIIFPKGKTTWEEFVLPKFKVGDRIRHKTLNKNCIYEISKVYDDCYGLVGLTWALYMKRQDDYELVSDKFDINTLIPFESRVLGRDNDQQKWHPAIWGYYDDNSHYPYAGIGDRFKYCIPYKGNEHLLGATDECDEYYKNWK